MLILPAAALLPLSALLLTVDTQLIQDQLSLTRSVGQNASITCLTDDTCYTDIYWFIQDHSGRIRPILYINSSGTNRGRVIYADKSQRNKFTAEFKSNICEFKINKVKLSDSASYYCSCGRGNWDSHSVRDDEKSEQKPAEEQEEEGEY